MSDIIQRDAYLLTYTEGHGKELYLCLEINHAEHTFKREMWFTVHKNKEFLSTHTTLEKAFAAYNAI